jgi:hypothetical membrane protein
LSSFGTDPGTSGLWTIYLIATSIGLWLNGTARIEETYKIPSKRLFLQNLLNMSCISLFLVSVITNEFRVPHGLVAASFFVIYAFFIFLFGFWQIKPSLKKASFSIVISFMLLLTTLLAIPFSGLAMFEVAYIALITFWNWATLRKTPIERIAKLFG